jgi:hypothetical protein
MQWNSFGKAETPDDGSLWAKHVVKVGSDRDSCCFYMMHPSVCLYQIINKLSVYTIIF